MIRAEILRTTTFRLAAGFACFLAGSSLLLFAFIYWQTAVFETNRIDRLIVSDAKLMAEGSPGDLLRIVETRVTNDFHRVTYAGLFDAGGRRIAGNLRALPPDLPADGAVHTTEVIPLPGEVSHIETVRAVSRRLADGTIFLIGRNSEAVERLRLVVIRALEQGVIPAVLLSLVAGAFMSWRAQERVRSVHQAAERIRRGQLRERLPVSGNHDEFDRLTVSVNGMLDEIERLLDEMSGLGDEIAHDLRTPLTRVRTGLERARNTARSQEELDTAVGKAMDGLDQALSIITALLRIREIEAGSRRAGFASVDLAKIVNAIDELYQPIAEEKDIALEVSADAVRAIRGDRDLLIETVGNLVDNAIKFTPAGGRVRLSLIEGEGGPVIRIADTGPGIPAEERDRVFTRFYRSARARQVPGTGLGLSLVAAITKLHDIRIAIADGQPGCIIDLVFTGFSLGAV